MKFPRISRHDLLIFAILAALLSLELYVKREEFMHGSHIMLLVGIILGFSIGFKVSALHAGTGMRKALTLAENGKLDQKETEKKMGDKIISLTVVLEKRNKTINQLNEALADRDSEIRELVGDLEEYRKRHGRII